MKSHEKKLKNMASSCDFEITLPLSCFSAKTLENLDLLKKKKVL